MKFAEYIAHAPKGEMSRLCRVTGLGYSTINELKNGKRCLHRYDVAAKLSLATGGAVTIAELCDPAGVVTKGRGGVGGVLS